MPTNPFSIYGALDLPDAYMGYAKGIRAIAGQFPGRSLLEKYQSPVKSYFP
jgi:hypothetical protein